MCTRAAFTHIHTYTHMRALGAHGWAARERLAHMHTSARAQAHVKRACKRTRHHLCEEEPVAPALLHNLLAQVCHHGLAVALHQRQAPHARLVRHLHSAGVGMCTCGRTCVHMHAWVHAGTPGTACPPCQAPAQRRRRHVHVWPHVCAHACVGACRHARHRMPALSGTCTVQA